MSCSGREISETKSKHIFKQTKHIFISIFLESSISYLMFLFDPPQNINFFWVTLLGPFGPKDWDIDSAHFSGLKRDPRKPPRRNAHWLVGFVFFSTMEMNWEMNKHPDLERRISDKKATCKLHQNTMPDSGGLMDGWFQKMISLDSHHKIFRNKYHTVIFVDVITLDSLKKNNRCLFAGVMNELKIPTKVNFAMPRFPCGDDIFVIKYN